MTDTQVEAAPRDTAPVSSLPPRAARLLVSVGPVVGALLVLELLLFWGYFSGEFIAAPDDFIGSYNNEPFAWWHDGSLVTPADWVPYAWGGYPAALSIQNGSWYLPIGLATLFAPYSIHVAAVVQALHVGFGALGAYVLGRRFGLHRLASLFGLVAWFFAAGFYTNGLHPDIVRGFAWAPWIVLCLMPVFPWRRWWAVPVAALVLWQGLTATYPGIIVAFVYCGAAAILTAQIVFRPRVREYLLPLGVAVVAAALLCAPKFVTALELRGGGSPTSADDSIFSKSMVGTAFFPYDLATLPNDLSMRSFFVPAACWALLALVRWREPVARVVAGLGLTALLLGLPFWPWWELTAELPGMSISRFRMADFRTTLLLAVVLAAMCALSGALRSREARASVEGDVAPEQTGSTWVRPWASAVLGSVVVGSAAIGVLAHWGAERWLSPWTIVVTSAFVVAVLGRLGRVGWHDRRASAAPWAVVLILLTGVSGVQWAYSVTPPWRQARIAIEERAWGTTSESLIAQRSAEVQAVQRPARVPLDDAVAPPTAVHWNSSFYDGRDAVGGYVNLKGLTSFNSALIAMTEPATSEAARAFYAAPGIGVQVSGPDDLPSADETDACVDDDCGPDVQVRPESYRPGALEYAVTADADANILFNEAYYDGWRATACDGAECRTLAPRMGSAGTVLVPVPAGDWSLSLVYETPNEQRNRWAFAVGVLLAAGTAVVTGLASRRRRQSDTETSASEESRPADD